MFVETEIAGKRIILETGKMAKQANGAVVLKCGNLVLLATAVMAKTAKEDIDFFPLTVEYIEKMYSAGKIPGGFFKRENRAGNSAILTSRLIDRPIRPCFPDGLYNDVQVAITVLSYDESIPSEYLGILAASASLSISNIPFNQSVGAVIIGCINNELKVNPSCEELEKSTLNFIIAGTKSAILMIESESQEVSEDLIISAVKLARDPIKKMVELQEELAKKINPVKNLSVLKKDYDENLALEIEKLITEPIKNNLRKGNKQETEEFLAGLEEEITTKFIDPGKENAFLVKKTYHEVKKQIIRKTIISEKIRPDGRKLNEIRPISSEVGLLPSVHGSALFTRGETQSLAIVTLGTTNDEQIEDGLKESTRKRYYFHYNFPPFSVGEVGNLSRTGRRELGHGALAERAIKAVLPEYDNFPYTIRLVSEILESNGSSSMASVCGGTLCLMDAGVPISNPVSGIAMGLLIDNNDYTILSDIQGLEDHYGDMDFKVAGTVNGITALQLDIKVDGLSEEILTSALAQAKEGRLFILNKMLETIEQPRNELADGVPKIDSVTIPSDKIGLVIGAGGKMIKRIQEECGVELNIIEGDNEEAQVSISGKDSLSIEKAKNMVIILVKKLEVGEIYEGKVIKLMNFGAFIEIAPTKEGLLHISNFTSDRSARIDDFISVGDFVTIRIKEIDNQGRVNLQLVE